MNRHKQKYRLLWWALFLAASVLPLMALHRLSARFEFAIPGAYIAVVWVITAFLYCRDKRAAESRRQRTPESVLHLIEFLGGWPCAFWAQRILRHKIRKVAYQVVFWLIVLVHQVVAFDYQSGGSISGRVLSFLER